MKIPDWIINLGLLLIGASLMAYGLTADQSHTVCSLCIGWGVAFGLTGIGRGIALP